MEELFLMKYKFDISFIHIISYYDKHKTLNKKKICVIMYIRNHKIHIKETSYE